MKKGWGWVFGDGWVSHEFGVSAHGAGLHSALVGREVSYSKRNPSQALILARASLHESRRRRRLTRSRATSISEPSTSTPSTKRRITFGGIGRADGLALAKEAAKASLA